MTDHGSFRAIMEQLDAGNDTAAAEIFNRFSRRLMARAVERLDVRIRRTVDPEDVVQSVFRSFFQRHAQGEFEFTDWNGLWGLLVLLTLRKCGRKVDCLHAACRDVRRELPPGHREDLDENAWEAATRDPRPDEVIALADVVEQLMAQLDERQQRTLALRLEGFTIQEVSERVPCSERTVFRILDTIQGKLAVLCELDRNRSAGRRE